jgi:hypothetical protein
VPLAASLPEKHPTVAQAANATTTHSNKAILAFIAILFPGRDDELESLRVLASHTRTIELRLGRGDELDRNA